MSNAYNQYLEGNYAPVLEETTATSLEITGVIPKELSGRFIRNGPNPNDHPSGAKYHWFLGHGMLHGVHLDNGRALWYRNRQVASPSGQTPNTSVIHHAGKTLALVEAGGLPVEVDYELASVKDDMSIGGGFSAHPQLDPDSGELHAICYDWQSLTDHVRYVVIDNTGVLKSEIKIALPNMSMIHSMSITRHYAVIYDLPVTLSFAALATGSLFPFRWNEDHEARIGLLPRNGREKDIVWNTISPNFAFHPMNAHEDADGRVIIDIIRYDKIFKSDKHGPFGDSSPRLDRWSINPLLQTVTEEVIDQRPQEFPRCNPDLNGKPYRFGYTIAVDSEYGFPAIYKHEVERATSSKYTFSCGQQVGEAVFIPRGSAQSEDDGYLMTFVYDNKKNASNLAILDAQELNRGPIASIHLPVRVPYGFHGNWIPDPA
jgi:carotenoid cleavage dioxygenase-like enzyme